jgi:hypothetical protein
MTTGEYLVSHHVDRSLTASCALQFQTRPDLDPH